MKPFVKNSRGLSLVEVLAAVAISSFILASIYGVLLSGINAYKRIGIENELRSEADYVVAMMMNQLYQFSPDGIDTIESSTVNGQLVFVNNKQKNINSEVGWVEDHTTDQGALLNIELKNEALFINGTKISSDQLRIITNQSRVSYSCVKEEGSICRSGVVTLMLAVQDHDHADPSDRLYIKPFTLKTEFGF
ncbi:prepilin-type N-terminal cleavage/methylation domain-containing protein [Anoxybacillus rupiensis]|jgi:prepilin-type N-terminal cleavage/methylation domain-containing protein|uniref:Prepilin-type N-terminal cleavage/methylation domain-containing protein n=1 Tax=Anoxybacteroides rupiense TaxID=311460 RepID=A0ABT5W206_9BACL|nr:MULTISPECIES: prepilin-type N-terminal cleavage/methylation domain-containing protein [Anoxybacillus]MBS2771600.1 prepilin-type N-terminal cleavage/methylation domain-containing protein [Anoxybacillus rupiensis]MDE8562824.1 prepilin-type N-terminal cleavage/methylation domain-containing protein [Anoxybacillus rupiensis]QHC04952.1 prepilin-type N-terminal cleavage/methylation domain-containing protein [Anoxybacillus sp. PDR2]